MLRRVGRRIRDGVGATRPAAEAAPAQDVRTPLGRSGQLRVDRRGPTSNARRPPGLLTLVGTAVMICVAAGFLELAVLMVNVHVLHYVGLRSLKIGRHAVWMLPVAGTVAALCLAMALISPVMAWSVWHTKGLKGRHDRPVLRNWAGLVLGTLLLLGPLLAIRGMHAGAMLALAFGVGCRLRTWVAQPPPWWERVSRWGAGGAVVFLAGFALFHWNRVESATGRAWSLQEVRGPNLLWIVMDTVRADRMSLHGYERKTTPELERWAKEGITFDMARSAAPWTLPAHLTMLTGLWPFEHGGRVDRPYFGPSPTMAEHLRAKGYATGGIVANVRMCNDSYGVGRGFDHYIDYPCNHEVGLKETMCKASLTVWAMEVARRLRIPTPRPFPLYLRRCAPEITADARDWLDEVRKRNQATTPGSVRPFFLFLNFMDAHGPYLPSTSVARRFWTGPIPDRKLATPEGGWVAIKARDAATAEMKPQRQQELQEVTKRLSDLYDECLYGLDADLGRFLSELRTAGTLDNTWVVVTSDHGEHLGEHGQFGHGSTLYNESTHVPLILIPPFGGRHASDDRYAALRGRHIGVPVSHRDLPNTMSGLLLPNAGNPFPGKSLARHWASDAPASPDPILSQLEEQHLEGEDVRTDQVIRIDSVIDEDHVLIEPGTGLTELYELFEDRKQERNLVDQPAERSRKQRLARTLDALRPRPSGP